MKVEATVTQQEWQRLGDVLFRLKGSIQWLIGDWLAYGANRHYGDLKKLAAELDMDYGTLRNYAYVSNRIELSLRNDKLSYHHHVVVASLNSEEQKFALDYAAEHKLSVSAFRRWLQQGMPEGGVQEELPEQVTSQDPVVSLWGKIQQDRLRPWASIPPTQRQARLAEIATLRARLDEAERWYQEGEDNA